MDACERIREQLKQGVSRAELSEKLGVNVATIAKWLSGKRNIAKSTVILIESLYGDGEALDWDATIPADARLVGGSDVQQFVIGKALELSDDTLAKLLPEVMRLRKLFPAREEQERVDAAEADAEVRRQEGKE